MWDDSPEEGKTQTKKKKHVQNNLRSRSETSGLNHAVHLITTTQILLEFESKLPMSPMVTMVIPAAAKQNCPGISTKSLKRQPDSPDPDLITLPQDVPIRRGGARS